MQDGAMIDLSGQSGTWNLKSACTKGKTVVDFADDATIYVKLGNRSLASSSPVIAWTEESCPANLSSLAFKCGDADRKYGLLKKSDGIYVVSGLTITFY